MAIAAGDRVPDVKVFTFGESGPQATTTVRCSGKGKVVLFGVPGAFTPTCSDHHLPGFVLRSDELRAKGVDAVVCVSVNDPFVMGAWGKDQNVGDSVVVWWRTATANWPKPWASPWTAAASDWAQGSSGSPPSSMTAW